MDAPTCHDTIALSGAKNQSAKLFVEFSPGAKEKPEGRPIVARFIDVGFKRQPGVING
jgi:hypothetical protein